MSNDQEDELRNENEALRNRLTTLDETNAPLRALQLDNAITAEQKIGKANRGELTIEDSTMRDFAEAEKELDERFRKAGAFGSTAHTNAKNDFKTKMSESLAAIREGRLTNLQQRATSSSNRLQASLSGSRANASSISSSLQSGRSQSGFSRRGMAANFFKGVQGSIGTRIANSNAMGSVGNSITGGAGRVFGAGKNALGAIFGKKRSAPPTTFKGFTASAAGKFFK